MPENPRRTDGRAGARLLHGIDDAPVISHHCYGPSEARGDHTIRVEVDTPVQLIQLPPVFLITDGENQFAFLC